MQIQSTALVTIIGALVMAGAGLMISERIRHAQVPSMRPIQLLRRFFFAMSIFFVLMWLPNILLSTDPGRFPLAMAWGYVIGHIFLYISFITIAQMLCTMVPRLANKERLAVGIGIAFIIYQTALNTITMVMGTQPSYNFDRLLVQYNAFPLVGAGIGILALTTIFPASVLFLMNAVKNPAQRMRSGLMGIGFMLMTLAGPLHDVATNWQTYAAADIFTTLAIVLVGIGVMYRLNEGLSFSRPAASQVMTTPNSVQ